MSKSQGSSRAESNKEESGMIVKTTRISAVSRASVKIRDNFFTFEYSEERTIEYAGDKQPTEDELNAIRDDLWNTCNDEISYQINELRESMHK